MGRTDAAGRSYPGEMHERDPDGIRLSRRELRRRQAEQQAQQDRPPAAESAAQPSAPVPAAQPWAPAAAVPAQPTPAAPVQAAPPAAASIPLPAFATLATTPSHAATILTVCTGNICRSPMGEVLLRARLGDLGVRVHSAGTHALVDHGMTEQASQLAVARGASEADAGAHRARYLTEPILAETDLVLAMTREHRSYVVQMDPRLLRRTFTVREFARLASTLSDDQARQAVQDATDASSRLQALALAVGAQRGLTHAAPEDDDVIDPYRRSQETYELSASQLVPALDEVDRLVRAVLT